MDTPRFRASSQWLVVFAATGPSGGENEQVLPEDASSTKSSSSPAAESAREEAARLLARAREIRDSLPPEEEDVSSADEKGVIANEEGPPPPSAGYRLYIDVGREPGTWMDPRWGASGARIEFTVDVDFLLPPLHPGAAEGIDLRREWVDESLADEGVVGRMVKDNFGGRSSPVRVLASSPYARMRGGFDKMACRGGGYRIDVGGGGGGGRGGDATVRFHLDVDGTPSSPSSTYGDVSVPSGCLHFSLPCFGGRIENLSVREGPVTVRQVGWHTGWRREESRIIGIFRARKIEEARGRDGY